MKELSQKTIATNNIEVIAPNEVFRQVPKYTKYYCSNYSRLLRQTKKGYKIVPASIGSGGYLVYTLSKPARKYKGEVVRDKNGKSKTQRTSITANRLVSLLFNYNPYEQYNYSIDDLESHHKDHNRQNNRDTNLMWLASGKNNTRPDHSFVNKLKKIALYDSNTAKYHTFRDIERLCKRINVDILELIDVLKDQKTPRIKDNEWTTYQVYDYFIGVQRFKRTDKQDMTPRRKNRKNNKQ